MWRPGATPVAGPRAVCHGSRHDFRVNTLFAPCRSATMKSCGLIVDQFPEVVPMTANVRQLLNSFDQLPEAEQREAASEILRRAIQIEFPTVEDAALVERAEELFLMLDGQEAAGETA